jgi:hypothetical protein
VWNENTDASLLYIVCTLIHQRCYTVCTLMHPCYILYVH